MCVLCLIYYSPNQINSHEDFEEQNMASIKNILLSLHASYEISNKMNILPELSVSTILKMVSKVERWRYRVSSRLWSMCCRRRRDGTSLRKEGVWTIWISLEYLCVTAASLY